MAYYPTVCVCFNVQDTTIQQLIKEGKDLPTIIKLTKAGTKCKRCLPRIHQMLKELNE